MFIQSQLDQIIKGYTDAMFFSMDILDSEGDELNPNDYELSSEAKEKIKLDCETFVNQNYALINYILANAAIIEKDYDLHSVGSDFLFTSNAEGVGFWDRGFGELGNNITKETNDNFNPIYLFLDTQCEFINIE